MKNNEEYLKKLRHSTSHILAMAVKKLYPKVKLGIGPAIKDGFYYDFQKKTSFDKDDLKKIEKEMRNIIKQNIEFKQSFISKEKAKKLFKDEPFKLELINELKGKISIYTSGDFFDLCAGPHIKNSKEIGAIKLLRVTSAYWRGNEKNKTLFRIYGVAFSTKEELKAYLRFLEEVKKRDHKIIGKKLDLFGIYDVIGPGLPIYHANGMVMRLELKKLIREVNRKLGFKELWTPHVAKSELWHQSGHYDHYKEDMYLFEHKGQEIGVKPMNCPFHIQVYKSKSRSYKDLPIRFSEFATVYRSEKSGELSGILRVRSLTQDDGHIWLLPSQIKQELKSMVKAVLKVYKVFGLKDHVINVSTRPKKAIGDKKTWDMAEKIIKQSLKEEKIKFIVKEGEGAFYGPKIDFDVKDAIGRSWQCGTIQLDFFMPERFEMEYVGEDDKKHRPVMIHRALFGSLDRFLGVLIEHFAGDFPTWISPVQVRVIPINDKILKYAKEIEKDLFDAGIRVEANYKSDSLGKKIRESELQKTPYTIVIGTEESKNKTISLRPRHKKEIKGIKLKQFKEKLLEEIKNRKLKLSY